MDKKPHCVSYGFGREERAWARLAVIYIARNPNVYNDGAFQYAESFLRNIFGESVHVISMSEIHYVEIPEITP